MSVIKEKQYIETVKKQTILIENKLIDSLEEKLNMKGSIPGNMKATINQKFLTQIKNINNNASDSDVKKMMEENLTSEEYGLEKVDEHVRIDLIDAAYHVYSTKRQMGSGRVMSFIYAQTFLHHNFLKYLSLGDITKEDLKKDMKAIFDEPFYHFIIGIVKITIAELLTTQSVTLWIIYNVMFLIQIVRFFFRLIKNNPFKYDIPVQEHSNNKDLHIHATYIYYKKLNLI